jgi:predicted dienelactone hydrolase
LATLVLASVLVPLPPAMPLRAAGGFGADAPFQAGFLSLAAGADAAIPVSVWYPTREVEHQDRLGDDYVSIARGAEPAGERHPLILLSHHSGGTPFDHRELAAALARSGYVVVAPTHMGDALGHTEAHGTDLVYIGRAWQAVAALDAVLADPRLRLVIDVERIGMAGLDTGGYTALLVAGGEPDLKRWPLYCDEHMDDTELCGGSLFPSIHITRPGWQPPHDPRIKALVLMAPLGLPFGRGSLDKVTVPVRLYEAESDKVLLRPPNAAAILAALPRPAEHVVVPGGHFVFIDPCPAALASMTRAFCVDAGGVDRPAIHRQLEIEIVDFFKRTL